MKPRIFISAVTKELKSARQLVANTLLALGFEPVWQDIFETHSGDIRPMLREKIDTCSAVLQIVGDAYGAEPPAPDEQFGRVSYTQYEALYARSRGKQVYYLVAEANLPRDADPTTLDLPKDDSADSLVDAASRKQLQQEYRAKVLSSEQIYYSVQTHPETELTVRRLKSDLDKLRRWFQSWMLAISAAILISLAGVAWVSWGQLSQSQKVAEQEQRLVELQTQANNPERTRQQLETTILRTYEKAIAEADKLTEWRKREDAKELAKSQRDSNLARVDEFLQAILTVVRSGNASPEYLEMTRIFNEQGAEEAIAYIASRKQDLLAKSRASKEANRQTNLLPILEQARKQVLLGQYDEARQTCDELLAEDPTWGDAIHVQFWILVELGDRALRYETVTIAEQRYQESHRLAETLDKLPVPHPHAQRDLGASHNRLGNVLLQLGQPQQALTHYEAAHRICQKLATTDPHDARAQRDLSVSHNRLGDIRLRQGQPQQALSHYEACHIIIQKLAAADPRDGDAQGDLSASHENLGDVLRQLGQVQQALAHYEADHQISQNLATANPSNSQAQRVLWVSHNKLGLALLELGQIQQALTHFEASNLICQKLAAADPRDTDAKRDLSISHNMLGDIRLQLGAPQEALTHYEASHLISQQLATADPRDTQAQRDLSISHSKLGDVLMQRDQLEQTLTHAEAADRILRKLAIAYPRDARAQRDFVIGCYKLGQVANELGNFATAKRSFADGIAILDQMIAASQLEQSSRQQKSELEREFARSDSSLRAVGDWDDLLAQPAEELLELLTLRCMHLAKKGQRASVQQAAEKLLTLEPKAKLNYYNAACGFGLCLKLASGWSGRGPFPPAGGVPEGTEEEQRLRKEYRAQAIAALKQAIAAGWDDYEHLRQDDDLAALRGDPEWEALFPQPPADESHRPQSPAVP